MDEPEPASAGEKLTFTLLTRRECPLCDEFLGELARWDKWRRRYTLKVVDIDTNPHLAERYGTRVPVLMHGEIELCVSHFNEQSLNEFVSSA